MFKSPEAIGRLLAGYKKQAIKDTALVRAAVLVPIFSRDGEVHLLFNQRSDTVEHHKGQVCFPGGAWSEEDGTLLDTALRESYEEIGLQAEDVKILGELDEITTTLTGFLVTPFVGLIPYPYDFKVSSEEIVDVFSVPLAALYSEGQPQVEYRLIGDTPTLNHIYQYQGRTIWGATARMTTNLLELLRHQVSQI